MTKVACDDGTGILTIHDESETCNICKPVVAEMIGEPGYADKMRMELDAAIEWNKAEYKRRHGR